MTEIDERNIERDTAILTAATELATLHGLAGFTRGQVADRARLSPAGVSNFGRSRITNGPQGTRGVLDRIRDAVVTRAVTDGDLTVLAVALAARHPIALAAPAALRIAAVAGA